MYLRDGTEDIGAGCHVDASQAIWLKLEHRVLHKWVGSPRGWGIRVLSKARAWTTMVKVTMVSAHPKGLGPKEAAKAWYS